MKENPVCKCVWFPTRPLMKVGLGSLRIPGASAWLRPGVTHHFRRAKGNVALLVDMDICPKGVFSPEVEWPCAHEHLLWKRK